jgi:hypothetical protein
MVEIVVVRHVDVVVAWKFHFEGFLLDLPNDVLEVVDHDPDLVLIAYILVVEQGFHALN